MRTLPITGALVLAFAATSVAAATPVVPGTAQSQIEGRAPTLAYVPTRLAVGFHYRGWRLDQGTVRIWFANKAGWEIVFVAAPLHGGCRAGLEKSFQLAGNKVYWRQGATEQEAWRCVATSTGGRAIAGMVRLTAASPQPPTRFADVGLGRIAASAKRLR